MQVGTYPTRNFAHTILIFRSGMDFLFIQFAHMPYNHYVQMGALHKQSTLDTQRKVSEDPKDSGFLRIVQSLAFLLYTFNAHYLSLCIFATYAYIPKILVSCGLSNQGFRIYVCIVQSCLLYTSIKSSKEFPAYSWVVHSCLTTRGGKPSYLRTVIVTAAVYWGFSR